MHVGPKVVDPELLCPGFASVGPVVEEEDIKGSFLKVLFLGRYMCQEIPMNFIIKQIR